MWTDQSVTLQMALHWIHGGPMPLAGDPSSSGLHNPPLVIYLYGLALLFKPDPLAVVWLIGLINLLGLLGAGLATARVFGWRAAWWASLLFVVNPWAAYFSRLIWMPSFVPAFSSLLYACILLYFAVEPKPRYLILGAVCLAATIQTHMASVVLIAVIGLIGLCFFRRLKLRPVLAGIGLFLICWAPYIIFQFQTKFDDLRNMQYKMGGAAQTNLSLPVLMVLDLLHSTGIFQVELGQAADLWRSLDLNWLHADTWITLWLSGAVIGAVISAAALRKAATPQAAGSLILLLWLCVPLPAFVRFTHEIYNYYFFFVFPVPFVLMALFADRLYLAAFHWAQRNLPAATTRNHSRRTLLAGCLPAARALAAVAFLSLAVVAFQQARLTLIGQDLRVAGVSGQQRIVDMRRAMDNVRQLLAARPQCPLVIVQRQTFNEASPFGLMREFVDLNRIRYVETGKSFLIPSPCAVYFVAAPSPAIVDWLNQAARLLPDRTMHMPEETWTFYDLPADRRVIAVASLKKDAPVGAWTNGVQLDSFSLEGDLQSTRENNHLTLITNWEVTDEISMVPEMRQLILHSGNYLLSPKKSLVSQEDGVGYDSREWRPGDIFQTFWEVPVPPDLPPGDYALATAFYALPGPKRVPLVNDGGDLLVMSHLSKAGP